MSICAEESRELDWCTRYKIIKGICEGLYYLHGRWKESIYHLDLKPANILLDRNMVPKIADFGLSRLFGGEQTHTTRNCIGTELVNFLLYGIDLNFYVISQTMHASYPIHQSMVV